MRPAFIHIPHFDIHINRDHFHHIFLDRSFANRPGIHLTLRRDREVINLKHEIESNDISTLSKAFSDILLNLDKNYRLIQINQEFEYIPYDRVILINQNFDDFAYDTELMLDTGEVYFIRGTKTEKYDQFIRYITTKDDTESNRQCFIFFRRR